MGSRVRVSFSNFALEGCPYDYVELRDGQTSYSPLLGKYCGSTSLPPALTTNSRYLYIRFVSDSSTTYSGFRLQYNITTDGSNASARSSDTVCGPDGCYKVMLTRQNWTESKQICERQGGHLAFIESQREQNTVVGIVQNTISAYPDQARVCNWEFGSQFHIGARRSYDSCSARWVWKGPGARETNVTYTNWNPGEPNCYGQAQFCAVLAQADRFNWDDIPCENHPQAYSCAICEFDNGPGSL